MILKIKKSISLIFKSNFLSISEAETLSGMKAFSFGRSTKINKVLPLSETRNSGIHIALKKAFIVALHFRWNWIYIKPL